jgi:multidrug efflux pump
MLLINFVGENTSERSIYQAALKLQDDVESIPSVLNAEMRGQREEVLAVTINPKALNAYRISAEELINTLQRNNRLIPAGAVDLDGGRFAVKVPAVVEEAQDILDLPIRSSGDTVVSLEDVATVRRTFKDRSSFARYNGRDTITISVTKRANANVIDSVTEVLESVEAARASLPAGIEIIF